MRRWYTYEGYKGVIRHVAEAQQRMVEQGDTNVAREQLAQWGNRVGMR